MSELASKLEQVQKLISSGRLDEARASLMRLAPKHGAEPALNRALALVLMMRGELPQAAYYAQRAADQRPDDPAMQHALGMILGMQGQTEPAIAALRRTLTLNPQHLEAYRSLGKVLLVQDRLSEAVEAAQEGLKRFAHDSDLSLVLAGAQLQGGHAAEAVRGLEGPMAAHPLRHDLACQRAFSFNYVDDADPADALAAHTEVGRRLAKAMPLPRPPMKNPREPERRIRVGFLSPDFNAHSVAFYIEPVLEKLDRAGFHVSCYDTMGRRDGVNERLRKAADAWRDCKGTSPVDVARRILTDQIDVLVDLAGYTTNNSLPVLHLKPAPIIATYLGYPNTTGLDCVDWRIVDSITDPVPAADARATERLWRLDPCFLCYRPPKSAPEPASAPAASGAPVTFGSFNHQQKMSDATVATWAAVMRDTPGSRLLLKNAAMFSPEVRQRTIERFGAHGIGAERLELIDQVADMAAHLALYGRIDIGLDPLPYNGTTTTCEALFMGVPVVSLAGQVHAARVGASLLPCIGASELVAREAAEYIRIATELAQDAARLAAYRATLRDKLLGSPLCDEAGFAARFGAMLREMWRGWCGA